MKAAALNDMVQQYQRILAGKKVANAKYFLAAAEHVREVIDEDTQGAAAMRTILFVLSGDYHGEFDETVGVDLSKTLFPRFVGYGTVAYTFVGSPAGTRFDNSFGWSVGAAYLVARPFSVFAFLDGSTAISPGQANPLEVRVGADVRLTQALKIFGSVSRGLSDGSADWGVSAGLALRF